MRSSSLAQMYSPTIFNRGRRCFRLVEVLSASQRPESIAKALVVVARRMMMTFERVVRNVGEEPLYASCSFGVADTTVASGYSLVERAMHAMRAAKLDGARLCVATSPQLVSANMLAA